MCINENVKTELSLEAFAVVGIMRYHEEDDELGIITNSSLERIATRHLESREQAGKAISELETKGVLKPNIFLTELAYSEDGNSMVSYPYDDRLSTDAKGLMAYLIENADARDSLGDGYISAEKFNSLEKHGTQFFMKCEHILDKLLDVGYAEWSYSLKLEDAELEPDVLETEIA